MCIILASKNGVSLKFFNLVFIAYSVKLINSFMVSLQFEDFLTPHPSPFCQSKTPVIHCVPKEQTPRPYLCDVIYEFSLKLQYKMWMFLRV